MATHSMGNKGTTTISLPKDMLSAARARARKMGISFSRYAQLLVEEDLDKGGDVVLRERSRPINPRK